MICSKDSQNMQMLKKHVYGKLDFFPTTIIPQSENTQKLL